MNAELAAFHVVHDYPGGSRALAVLVGKNEATLSHEVDPNYSAAKFGLGTAVKVTKLARDLRILTAFGADCGCMVLPLPTSEAAGNSFEALSEMATQFAELVASITDSAGARSDGGKRVTPNEVKRVEKEAGELIAAVQAALLAVHSMAAAHADA